MDYAEILRAYNQAVARGADRAQAAAEVRRLTGMSPAQLQARVNGTGGAAQPARGRGAPSGVDWRGTSAASQKAREEVMRAYQRALPRVRGTPGSPGQRQLATEVQQLTGMTVDELGRITARDADRRSTRLLAQGITLGFGDELAGVGAAIIPGGRNYTQARDASRRRLAVAREAAEPGEAMLTEGLGSMFLPMVGAERVGASILQRTGSRVLAGGGAGVVGGASAGAIYGAGDADGDLGSRFRGAAGGAAVGAITGGALGAGAAVAGRAGGRLAGRSTSRARDQAARVVRQELSNAGVQAEEVPSRLAQMGEGSVVADLGENLGRQARAAINNAPELAAPGGPVQRIRARTADTRNRVANALREASGLSQSFEESLAAAEQGIRQVRQQFYGPLEQAFPEVQGPQVQAALRDARVARAATDVSPAVAAGNRAPSFTELQDIMLTLRDDVTAARALGRPNASRRAAEAYDLVTAAMAQDIPGFTEAQAAYRHAISRVDAHKMGRKLASKDPADIRRALAELPPESHDAFRQGLLYATETRLRRREGGAAGDWIDAGRTTQEVGRVISGGDDQFSQLMQTLRGREQPWRATGQKLLGNSTTAEQIADGDAFLADLPTSTSSLVSRLADYAVGPSAADRSAAAAMIGRTLLAEGPEAAQRLAELLRRQTVTTGLLGAAGGTVAGTAAGRSQPQPEPAPATPGLLFQQ